MIAPENVKKKIDNLGRITIPKGLRDRFCIEEGMELDVWSGEIKGKRCVIFFPPQSEDEGIDI